MENNFKAEASINIHAPASKVWDALIDPELIKQYLFGTTVSTDWKKGSPITYSGEWQGKQYEDKGKIIEIIPGEMLETTYWSSMGGTEDMPENYANVKYEIEPQGDETKLTITQTNIASEQSAKHSEGNWTIVLNNIKELLEQ